ncbi:MAG: hypothetical protein ABWK53_12290 [Anaerolineales bacterium]
MAITLQPYSKETFIHRSEVDLIQGKFKQFIESGGSVRPPKAILFRGERGFGKTWLCFHLHRTVLPELSSSIKSLYMALFDLPKEYRGDQAKQTGEWVIPQVAEPADEACKKLMKWICDQLEISYPNDPTWLEMRRALVGGVETKFTGINALVLILDSVFEAGWDLLEVIEENMLAPLAELPNVFFIMTGRGRPYPWISPTLRMGVQEEALKDFPIEQLTKGDRQVAELSGGSPLVAYALMQTDDPVRALDEVTEYLLEVIPPSMERRRLRDAFEAFCVLDEFREGEMETMLRAYYEAKKQPLPPYPIRDVRDELLKTYLFRWEGGGFRVDASLKNVLRNYLKQHQPELWRHLNCAAYQIYLKYADKYTQYRTEYQALAAPYREVLESHGDLAECEKTLTAAQPA